MKPILSTLALLLVLSASSQHKEDFWELLDTPEGINFCDFEHFYGTTIVASTGSGVYISHDNGDTWDTTGMKESCRDIETKNGLVLVNSMPGAKLWYSTDTCKTWMQVEYSMAGPYLMTIHIDDDNSVYIGSNKRVYRSLDTCKTWQEVMYNPESPWGRDIGRNPATGSIYVCFGSPYDYHNGLWGSETGDSATWAPKNMLHDNVASIFFDKDGGIYTCVHHNLHTGFNGVYKNVGDDSTWEQLFWCSPPSSLVILPNKDMYVAAPIVYGEGEMYYYNAGLNELTVFESEAYTTNIDPLKLINGKLFAYNNSSYILYRSMNSVLDAPSSLEETSWGLSPTLAKKGQDLTLTLEGEITNLPLIRIFNVNGSRISRIECSQISSSKIQIGTNKLTSGVYILNYKTNSQSHNFKFIIK